MMTRALTNLRFTTLWSKAAVAAATLLLAMGLLSNASLALTLNVIDEDGRRIGTGFYWTLQEDNTFAVTPGISGATDILSFGFHKSHRAVLSKGDETDADSIVLPPTGRYYISVLPKAGHSMSGTSVTGGQTRAVIWVHKHPIPTTQISVFAFPVPNLAKR